MSQNLYFKMVNYTFCEFQLDLKKKNWAILPEEQVWGWHEAAGR